MYVHFQIGMYVYIVLGVVCRQVSDKSHISDRNRDEITIFPHIRLDRTSTDISISCRPFKTRRNWQSRRGRLLSLRRCKPLLQICSLLSFIFFGEFILVDFFPQVLHNTILLLPARLFLCNHKRSYSEFLQNIFYNFALLHKNSAPCSIKPLGAGSDCSCFCDRDQRGDQYSHTATGAGDGSEAEKSHGQGLSFLASCRCPQGVGRSGTLSNVEYNACWQDIRGGKVKLLIVFIELYYQRVLPACS